MTAEVMHRHDDPETSADAAERVRHHLTALQLRVLEAFERWYQRRGIGATDGEIEALPDFRELRPTTVRKRRLELERKGLLRSTGEKRRRMTVFVPVQRGRLF